MRNRPQKRVVDFIEELAWLLDSYYTPEFGHDLSWFARSGKLSASDSEEFTPANPNIAFLVGALPGLFMNRRLFPRNEDIANFAEKVLKLNVTRTEKRSQYELVGLIVCEVLRVDDSKLSAVVRELKQYVSTKGPKRARDAMGWNEVIRHLTGEATSETHTP